MDTNAAETIRLMDVKAIRLVSLRQGWRCQLCVNLKGITYPQVVGGHVRRTHFNRFAIAMMGVES